MCSMGNGTTVGCILIILISSSMTEISTGSVRTAKVISNPELHMNDPSGISSSISKSSTGLAREATSTSNPVIHMNDPSGISSNMSSTSGRSARTAKALLHMNDPSGISYNMSSTSARSARTAKALLHMNDPSGIHPAFIQYPGVDHRSAPTVLRPDEMTTFLSGRNPAEIHQQQQQQQRQQSTNEAVIEDNNANVPTTYDVISQLLDTQKGLVRTADSIALSMQNLTGSMVQLSISVQNSMAIIAQSMQKMTGTISNLTAEMVNMQRTIEDRFHDQEIARTEQKIENLVEEDCPGVWELVGGLCLRIISRPNKTWDDARSYCQHLGGDLAAPEDLQTLRLRLKGEIENFIWLGAHDRITDGDWRWLISGKPVEEDAWAPGEPNRGKTHNCACLARRDDYKFHDCLCDYRMGFICQLIEPEAWDHFSEY